MINLLITVLPLILIAYYLIRFMDEPIYLLGIPFLMFFRFSIFFERVLIFSIPGRFGPEILLLIWLIIVAIFITIKSRSIRERSGENKISTLKFSVIDYILILLLILSTIGLAFVLNENYIIQNVFVEYITMISLFFGYFLIKNLALNTRLSVLSEFLYTIVIVNTIASLLYFVHQGLHITLYTSASSNDEYLEDFFQGEIITRTFWFMPILWFFSISYLMVFKRSKSIVFIILMSINVLAIFISYTRSFLLIAFLIVIIYFLLTGYKNRDIGTIIKNFLVVGVAGIALFIGISFFLPASKNYFVERFKELDKHASDAESNTFLYRLQQTGEVINRIDPDKVIIGHGPITEVQMPFVTVMRATTSDLVWTGVVFRWGYLGLVLFVLLYIISMLKAFKLFMKTDGLVSQFALLFFLVIVSQSIEGFTSWTFMSPNRFAMGLWYFGILSAVLIKSSEDNLSKINFENEK